MVQPVFIRARSIPGDEHASTLEICRAAEHVSGDNTILGAQRIRSLWRIYPITEDARQTLIVEGISLRGVRLEICRENPYVVHDDGTERPVTKVWVGGVPISVADSEIEHALTRIGCEIRSDMKRECARNPDGGLTRFLTGRRFVFITRPTQPFEKFFQVIDFRATLYHKEQPRYDDRPRTCNNCLQNGHTSRECTNEVVCHACNNPGHRRGDPRCDAISQRDDEEDNVIPPSGHALPTSPRPTPNPAPDHQSERR